MGGRGYFYISPLDYGPRDNPRLPRWYVWRRRLNWLGMEAGGVKVAGPFWTVEEAQAAYYKLKR